MTITVEAVYENGVLKPAQPLPLAEYAKVNITIDSPESWTDRTAGILQWTGKPEELRRFLDDKDEGSLGGQ